VAGLLGSRTDWGDVLGAELNPAFKKITNAYFQTGEAALPEEDLTIFLDIVREFCHLSDDGQMRRLLAVCRLFSPADAAAQVAALLLDQRLYHLALGMYLTQLNQPGRTEAAALGCFYRQAAVCCYKLKDYPAAGSELGEYLAWCSQQCGDVALREQIEILLAQYGLA
jgi:hypothetical protein